MTQSSNTRVIRRFAPLVPQAADKSNAETNSNQHAKLMQLKGIVFDVDGTLCLPQNYMFGRMRAALGIPKSVDILTHIYSLPGGEQEAAMGKIMAIEREAMAEQAPQPGLAELMAHLDARGVRKAICTRNFNGPVEHLLNKFLPHTKFLPIVTRDFKPPKPDPAGILHIARELGIDSEPLDADQPAAHPRTVLPIIMVGDSVDDMLAGRAAGAATVLLANEENRHLEDHDCTDLVVRRLDELAGVLDRGFVARLEPTV